MQINNFPFCAVAGQHNFKLALILNAINPAIGGVLVSGPRGCAKSTLARGIADILPGEHDLVTLPLGASEEMLVGTLDLQQVLAEQKVNFNPGLLAKANNGVLYVDEVNLLADSLIDLLLDVSASGINYVERDGISHQHVSRFILLGTMNPDEGELRAQLLDRFGLSVLLSGQNTIEERIEIVRLRECFDRDPQAFINSYQAEQEQIRARIISAKQQLPNITCSNEFRHLIATRCFQANVDGLRADIVWLKAACAHTAWSGRKEVNEADVLAVEGLVLNHRKQTLEKPPTSKPNNPPPPFSRPPSVQESPSQPTTENQNEQSGEWGSMAPQQQQTAQPINAVLPKHSFNAVKQQMSYSAGSAQNALGPIIGGQKKSKQSNRSVNWFGSLLSSLGQWPPQKLRFKDSKVGQPIINCILLDTSASTLKRLQFSRAKAVVLELAQAAYRQREHLVIFGFGNQQVQQLMVKQKAPKLVKQWLDKITAAGGTPLREMLEQLGTYQSDLAKVSPALRCRNFLITDGRSSQNVNDLTLIGETLLIDIEDAAVKRGRGVDIARQLNGQYFLLPS
jgi:magnesium chelatase subunit D